MEIFVSIRTTVITPGLHIFRYTFLDLAMRIFLDTANIDVVYSVYCRVIAVASAPL